MSKARLGSARELHAIDMNSPKCRTEYEVLKEEFAPATSFATADLAPSQIEAIAKGLMSAEHDPLNALVDAK